MQTVKVKGNHATVQFEKPYPTDAFRELMQFRVKGWFFIPAVKNGTWDGYVSLLKYHKISTGLYRALKTELEKTCEVRFEEHIDWNPALKFGPIPPSDREWQTECVAAMHQSMRYGGGTILAATSAGKTAMAAQFYASCPGNHLFVVDQRKLMYQAQADLAQFLGEPVGIVGDQKFEPGRVTVGIIQTLKHLKKLTKLMDYLGHLTTVVVDELHTQLADKNFAVVGDIEPVARFGLTATLDLDNKEIALKSQAFCGPVIYTYNIARGMQDGILSKVTYHQIRFKPLKTPKEIKDAKELHALRPDLYQRIDGWKVNVLEHEEKHKALKKLVRGYLNRNRYIVILADKHAHIEVLRRRLDEFDPMVITGRVKKSRADDYIDLFERGVNRLIIASRVFNKGISIHRIDTIINVGELEDVNTIVQQIGRELRLHDDKNGAIFVDFGTTVGRYRETAQQRYEAVVAAGIPARIHYWERDRSAFFDAVRPPRAEELADATL